jgi:hypothetical protein
MPIPLPRLAGAGMAASIVLLSGCFATEITSPAASTRLAVTTRLDNKPALILQNLDGRDTLRFHFQNVADNVPGNTNTITLSDDAVLNVSGPRWDRVGGRVAVVVSAAFDQSEVVLFDVTNGRAMVASPNSQIIGGPVDWAQSGMAIAYTMSTVLTSGIDLFTTNLSTMQVKRLTTGANLSQSVIRWNLPSNAVYFSQHIGDAKDIGGNWISQIARVTVASSVVDTIRGSIVGQVQAISRSGEWALVLRTRTRGIDTFRGDLVRLNLIDGSEMPLITDEMVMRAQLSSEESRALVAVSIGPAGANVVYDLIDLGSGARARIPGVGGSVDVDIMPQFMID